MRLHDPAPAALVRPATDLAALAAEINAQHKAGEDATRRGLEHFRAAGKALLRAKAACGHGGRPAGAGLHAGGVGRRARAGTGAEGVVTAGKLMI
jgi:hypothetical protein